MDFTIVNKTSQNMLDVQKQLSQDVNNHGCKSVELFNETERKENNNYSNSLKTEVKSNQGSHPSSLFPDNTNEDGEQMPTDSGFYCKYPNCTMLINLSIHNESQDMRTIFDDAEYFSKNYSYKLLPINFESVDETIIHSEHNYCNISQSSGSEGEEDCSRTMDYIRVKEKNYKKRKSRIKENTTNENLGNNKKCDQNSNESSTPEATSLNNTEEMDFHNSGSENGIPVQPLDLSAPSVQSEKTERTLGKYITTSDLNDVSDVLVKEEEDGMIHREEATNEGGDKSQETSEKNMNLEGEEANRSQKEPVDAGSRNQNEDEELDEVLGDVEKYDSTHFDSDKENQKGNKNLIEVTITRGDGKNNYQPCDSFLNDIAKLVPKIVKKDCNEIDILDRTCDSYVNFEKHRLYYVISESTWRLFQNANERVILTNDRSLGQPVQKVEKDERPTYLIFDQFSLAKCLADYCKEIGGCFEYKFVEEGKEESVNTLDVSSEANETKNDEVKQDGEKHFSENKSENVPSSKCQESAIDEILKTQKETISLKNESSHSPPTEPFKECAMVENGIENVRNVEEMSLSTLTKECDTNKPKTEVSDEAEIKKEMEEALVKPNSDSNLNSVEESVKIGSENGFCAGKKDIDDHVKNSEGIELTKSDEKGAEKIEKLKKDTDTEVETAKKEEAFNKPDEATQETSFAQKKRSRSLNSSTPASGVGSQKQRKRTLSKSENKISKKVKMNEGSSVRTRSKSASETEVSRVKSGKRVTSQNSIESSPTKGTKRAHSLSENFPKSTDKDVGAKEKIAEVLAPGGRAGKRSTRSETGNSSVINNNDIQNKSNKSNKSNNNKKKSGNSVIIDNNKSVENKKKTTLKNAGAKDEGSNKVGDVEKKESPKNPMRRSNRKVGTKAEEIKKVKAQGKGVRNQSVNATEGKLRSENKKKVEVSSKRTRSKEDAKSEKILPKRKRR